MIVSSPTSFGHLPDGKEVFLYPMQNSRGVTMQVMNLGGIIVSLNVPDREGRPEDIVLGFDALSDYINYNPFFGALIGRYANRIAKGMFTLEGKTYQLDRNNDGNHLHGGYHGYHTVFWEIEPLSKQALRLTYNSVDGEEKYPGNLSIAVTYTLTDQNELIVDYHATTDAPTIVNLTQHSYFNLSGNSKRKILDHEVMIDADRFLPVDATLIPTGEFRSVEGTPFDFRNPKRVDADINQNDAQLELGNGFDHCWVLRNPSIANVAASAYDPHSGRRLDIFTSEPGVQLYSGNYLDGKARGKFNTYYEKYHGLCLETQHFPDSPNQRTFPTVILLPSEVYRSKTIFKFSVQ